MLEGSVCIAVLSCEIVRSMAAALQHKSEYLLSLSAEAKQRFESNITGTGLAVDPYVIDEWTQDPANFPRMSWSDVRYTWFPHVVLILKKQ